MGAETPPPEGTLTSATLTQLVRRGVGRRLAASGVDPAPVPPTKTAMLERLAALDGASAVVELGLEIQALPDHPVIAAVASAPSAPEVLQRWTRIERFGHTRNRTAIEPEAPPRSATRATLRHVATDGEAIAPVDDLFIWGVLVGLLQRAGFGPVVATLAPGTAAATRLVDGGAVRPRRRLTADTACVELRWSPRASAPEATPTPTHADAVALRELLVTDLVHPWRIDEAARRLGLSSRQLQRVLQKADTSFSRCLQLARVEAARALMSDPRLVLTEIAFCTGFSDQAHLSRIFRRHLDVPPSAYRQLLLESSAGRASPDRSTD